MTTHYQKIQALGNRMAENLTLMGVPSQFDEGGLTLADKILEIRDRFTSGILLYADKKIAQTGDTVKLYSLFLKDEIPQSGKTIRFIGDGLSTTVTKGEFEKIDGNHFYFNSPPSGSTFTLGRNNCIIFDHNSFAVVKDMVDTNYYTNGGIIRIKDKTVYYTDNNGVSQALDTGLSYLNEVRFVNNITPSFTILGYAEAVTGDDGVACVQYSCTGSGLREFYATSGTFVSEIYEVLDVTFKDIGTSTDYSAWTNSDFTGDALQRNDEYTTLIPQDNYDQQDLSITTDCCVEFDVNITYTSSVYFLRFRNGRWTGVNADFGLQDLDIISGQWHHLKFLVTSNKVTPIVDGVTKTAKIPNGTMNMVVIILNNEGQSNLKYKNFVVYPI